MGVGRHQNFLQSGLDDLGLNPFLHILSLDPLLHVLGVDSFL
jgi:hypothetical protein